MSYPDYPNNRLIVNGVDLTEKFKMVLLDGYTLAPPEPKTYIVDIPCSNGSLDLTESLFGDVTYKNRSHKFTFSVINTDDFENIKTQISNMLHGRAFDYKMTMDPDYTYHGRFKIESYGHKAYMNGIVGSIVINIDADPYKYKPKQEYKLNNIGGNIHYFESGRKRVCPSFTTEGNLKVFHNGVLTTLSAGTWKINDVVFTQGTNELYLNFNDVHYHIWRDLKNNTTWGEFKNKPLYEWYKTKSPTIWEDLTDETWESESSMTWDELSYYIKDIQDVKEISVSYDWGDL